MEKKINSKEAGLWVVRDYDGLYLCTRKPYKNFYGEHEDAFTWSCEGDFMKISVSPYSNFSDMTYSDEPKRVEIVPEHMLKGDID